MTTPRKQHLDGVALAVLLACCSVWGLAQVAAKLTLAEVPPLLQSGLRSAGAAVLLVLWSRWRGLSVFGADGTGRAGLLAGAMFALEFGCIFVGLQFTTASRMSVFLYLAPRLLGAALLTGSLATAFVALAWLSFTFQALLLGAAWVRVRDDPPGGSALGRPAATAEPGGRGE